MLELIALNPNRRRRNRRRRNDTGYPFSGLIYRPAHPRSRPRHYKRPGAMWADIQARDAFYPSPGSPRRRNPTRRRRNMGRITKSHPVAVAMRRGLSMKAAWRAYKGRRGRRRRRNSTGTPFSGTYYRPRLALYGRKTKTAASKRQLSSLTRRKNRGRKRIRAGRSKRTGRFVRRSRR